MPSGSHRLELTRKRKTARNIESAGSETKIRRWTVREKGGRGKGGERETREKEKERE